jgi:hypothetical protein
MAQQVYEEITKTDKESPLADSGALYRFERRTGL